MKRAASALAFLLALAAGAAADNWPAWRGPDANGVSKEKNLPLKWSPTENVRWKINLPERGNSTPIVWDDRIFLTQALEKQQQRTVMCFRRKDGKLLWQKAVEYKEKERTHQTNPYCSASPVTDGERVVASHGSAGVVCYDFDGKELWRRDLGKFDHIWGNAASPIIYGDLVLLNCGPGERTFLIALNKKTGEDVWKVEEPGGKDGSTGGAEWIGSWSTPTILHRQGRDELLMSWPEAVKAYDPKTGELLWTCKGLTKLVYTSPLVTPEVVVAMSGFNGSAIALKPGGKGDITEANRLWRTPKAQQRIGSGVLVGDHIYMLNEPGTMQCIEWQTGKELWSERVGAGVWGSLVHADGRLYVTNLEGETYVFAAKPKYELLAKNPLQERTLASIAVSDGELFIRTYEHLWCIGK